VSDYPEHDRLRAVKIEAQAIGEFLDFGGYVLAKFREAGDNGKPVWHPEYDVWGDALVPVGRPIPEVLADYFEIDLTKIEAEKRAMLDALQQNARVRMVDEGNQNALQHIAEAGRS
jgi:hypothetical protein